MKFNYFLFDFDGTLVDSMPTYISVMLRILDENGVAYGSDIVKIITPLGYRGTAKYFREVLGLKMDEDKIVEKMNEYAFVEYRDNIPAKDGVKETLLKLKSMGCDLNILTASPHSVLDVCLKRLGIFELFTNVWSCDDFNTTKADPEIYRAAAAAIGAPIEKVLFLDDNYNADKTASMSGIKVCGVYDSSSEDYTDEIKSVSDYYAQNLSDLFSLLA